MMTIKQKEKICMAGIFLTAIIWGYTFVAVKLIVKDINFLYLVGLRKLFAALLLSLIFLKKMRYTTLREIKISIPVGIALFLGFALQSYSTYFITAGKTAFYTGTTVIFVPFLMWIIYKKTPKITAFLAAFVCFIGLAILTINGFDKIKIADLIAISCAVGFAMHIVLIDKAVLKVSSIRLAILQMYTVSFISLILAFFTADFPKPEVLLNKEIIFSFLYLAVFGSAAAYLLQNVCQKYVNASKSSLILSSESFIGAFCGIAFLGEPLTINLIFGGIFIFLSVFISENGENIIKQIF